MLKIAIVDDDSVFLNQTELILINTLNRRQCDFSLSKYFSAEEFLNDKNNININIAILDIELNDMNGIELSKTLYTLNKKTIMIFLTSHDIFIRKAFGLNVYRFILKNEVADSLPTEINTLIDDLSLSNKELLFKSNNVDYLIESNSIICLLIEGRNICLYTIDTILKLSSTITIKEVYNKLDKSKFVCPNSGAIINLDYIDTINTNTLMLRGLNINVSISRGRFKEINNLLTRNLLYGDMI